MNMAKILILGSNGQLGHELQKIYPDAKSTDVAALDITNKASVRDFKWDDFEIVINAAAYTNVDGSETETGRVSAWLVNAVGVANLVEAVNKHSLILVHVSTDYVFDGSNAVHIENESFSPLSIYGASKAAGDVVVSTAAKHYLVRTSWVIGDGNNFVKSMLKLGTKGISPSIVNDQIGRLTFAKELARAIDHLLKNSSEYGTYNCSNSGEPASWAEITRLIFKDAGFDLKVTDISTATYFSDKPESAKRPLNSVLDLNKLQKTGFISRDWRDDLVEYIRKELPAL
jgi:dTDP-4-dehydrorhamnose reductase